VRIRILSYPSGEVAAVQVLACPQDTYGLTLDPGTYLVRFNFITAPTLATLPLAQIDLDPVVIDAADVVRNVQVREGQELGGLATLNGHPLEGAEFSLGFEIGPFIAGAAESGPDGSWTDATFGRAALPLQTGVRFNLGPGCEALGTSLLAPLPASFLFPDEADAVNCQLQVAPSVAWTHEAGRLVVTPMPGDVGGQSVPLWPRFGRGYGVQFPVGGGGPGRRVSASQLFRGGLMITTGGELVLSGVDVRGFMDCGPGEACYDLGVDGVVRFLTTGRAKTVTWHYSDAASLERVGLEVVQHSFDGTGGDYVVFAYRIRNVGGGPLTVWAGFFGDWDIDGTPFADVAATDLGGRLMYATNEGETGSFLGTLLIGAPVSGTYAFAGVFPTLSEQVDALTGALVSPTAGPGDIRFIHSAGPIALAAGGEATVRIAVVAGDDKAQLLANAAAAESEVAARHAGKVH
jgi:hypothetical protein